MRVSVLSIFLILGIVAYGQKVHIEGHWRRIEPMFGKATMDKTPKVGDFIFDSDSTYTVVGDTTVTAVSIPGWHTGGGMKGKWSQSGSFLDLTLSDDQVPIRFKVVKLTTKELVFVSKGLDMKMRFIRL